MKLIKYLIQIITVVCQLRKVDYQIRYKTKHCNIPNRYILPHPEESYKNIASKTFSFVITQTYCTINSPYNTKAITCTRNSLRQEGALIFLPQPSHITHEERQIQTDSKKLIFPFDMQLKICLTVRQIGWFCFGIQYILQRVIICTYITRERRKKAGFGVFRNDSCQIFSGYIFEDVA